MTDPPIAARPKGVQHIGDTPDPVTKFPPTPEQFARQGLHPGQEPKRGPGRPAKGDPFTILTLIASSLQTVDKPVRRQILETLLALSE
jgi:hypothetical protein